MILDQFGKPVKPWFLVTPDWLIKGTGDDMGFVATQRRLEALQESVGATTVDGVGQTIRVALPARFRQPEPAQGE